MSTDKSSPLHRSADVVVVPSQPGRLLSLADIDRPRGEVDLVLDEMFGEVDTEGPGLTDAVLVGGGTCAVVASLIAGLPAAVLGAGIASIGLGAILPIRSVIRRGKQQRQSRKVRDLIGDGQLLNVSAASTREMAARHDSVLALTDTDSALGVRVTSIAHGLVEEVASLLEGRPPSTPGEEQYVAERSAALVDLNTALQEASKQTADIDAALAARLAVESHADRSALTEAAELTRDLDG